MVNGFERLAIPLRRIDGSNGGWWVIEPSSSSLSRDPDPEECTFNDGSLPRGWRGLESSSKDGGALQTIQVKHRAGQAFIRLLETQNYEWSIEGGTPPDDLTIQSTLKSGLCSWKDKRSQSGSFKTVNHLGLADFKLISAQLEPLELHFEFVSKKFDFDSEYRRLTEDIADFCQQLLLSWEAPTSLRFSSDPERDHELLLEQFLFLRNFMTNERLSRLLEAISRNPHSHLVKESKWVPAGAARSSDYLSDPCGMLRDWRKHGGRQMPGEVRDVHKNDTHDTAPNRFIKFALAQFRLICADVHAQKWTEDNKTSMIGMEASEMLEQIDSLLALRFFNEVGRMQRLPLDNQTLQKREGYREVLQGWLLTQAATTLNWEGERDCYKGSTRDVATLYEYWIFIQLHKILESMEGLEERKDNRNDRESFISEKDGQLSINLKQGTHSRSRYIWKSGEVGLHIDLQYERSFSGTKQANRSGSYTRRFRPDYTLSIYPIDYSSEAHSEANGKVAHLHLDAKYRAEDISAVFGKTDMSDEDIAEEKLESKAERTYRRGDLLKMHTYNDALRHTIGSYVLYPGTKVNEAEKLMKFHEIAPGVGAMVLKPGNQECLDSVREFLLDIFRHQADTFSQYRYLSDTSYRTYHDKPEILEEDGATYNVARKGAPCVLVYLKKEQAEVFRELGFAYCQVSVTDTSKPLNINLSIEIGSEFIPYGGSRSQPKKTLGWRGKIRTVRLMEVGELSRLIGEEYPSFPSTPHSATHYVFYEFSEVGSFHVREVSDLHARRKSTSPFMAITCTWEDILRQEPGSVEATTV